MKKIKQFILPLVLPVVLMGLMTIVALLLLGCPTAAPTPKAKDKGGGDDGGNTDFSVSNEYIDFHSYYGEISHNSNQNLTDVVFVASTSETPKAIGSIDAGAKMVRDFNQGETRKISLNWTDTFKTADLFGTGMDSTTARTGLVTINNDDDYKTNKVDWVLKENTQYYMHIYYNNGANTFTHSFKTLAYPTSTTTADDLFAGGNTGNIFNVNGRPTPIKWRASNPIVFSFAIYNHGSLMQYKEATYSVGGCNSTLSTCSSTLGLLIRFTNNTVLTNVSPAFNILDTVLIFPNLTFTINVGNPNLSTNLEWTGAYGGSDTLTKITDIVDR